MGVAKNTLVLQKQCATPLSAASKKLFGLCLCQHCLSAIQVTLTMPLHELLIAGVSSERRRDKHDASVSEVWQVDACQLLLTQQVLRQ